jgi:hypothetical protein
MQCSIIADYGFADSRFQPKRQVMNLQQIEQALCECSQIASCDSPSDAPARQSSVPASTPLGKKIQRWKHDRVRLKEPINPLRTLNLAVEAGIITSFTITGQEVEPHQPGKSFKKDFNGVVADCVVVSKVAPYLYEVQVNLSSTTFRTVLGHLEIS